MWSRAHDQRRNGLAVGNEREFASDKVYRRDDRGIVGVESLGAQGLGLFIDTTKMGRVAIREPLSMRIGYANDDLTRNLLRFVAEERLVFDGRKASRSAQTGEPAVYLPGDTVTDVPVDEAQCWRRI